MIKVALETQSNALVARAVIPDFTELPEVVIWGARTFKLRVKPTSEDTFAVYTEVFAYTIVEVLGV